MIIIIGINWLYTFTLLPKLVKISNKKLKAKFAFWVNTKIV